MATSSLDRELRRIKEQVEILWGDRGPTGRPERAVRLRELSALVAEALAAGGGTITLPPPITALSELDNDVGFVDATGAAAAAGPVAAAEVDDHEAIVTDAHAASAISVTAISGLSATDAQGALAELAAEKAPIASPTLTGAASIDAAGNIVLSFYNGATLRGTVGATTAGIAILSGTNPASGAAVILRPVDRASSTGQAFVTADGTFSVNNVMRPVSDNAHTLGISGARWSTVYAATGTINTSDAREKAPVQAMTPAEIAAAQAMAAEIGTYRWLAAIEAKGEAARTHIGLTVQRAIEIMWAHGLDAAAYGFICYDRWEAEDEQWIELPAEEDGGEPVRELLCAAVPAGDRYSFRMDQLALFLLAGERAARQVLEQRIAALEDRFRMSRVVRFPVGWC